jgi:hypothetical protein
MRRFFSYGPIDTELHYYVPRKKLIERAYSQLMGENPERGGHYITVWAPRQTGKSWVMLQVLEQIENTKFPHMEMDVVKVDLDLPEHDTDLDSIAASISKDIFIDLGKKNPGINTLKQLPELFTRDVLDKPLILIIDEFDALPRAGISSLTRLFRNIYMRRRKELKKTPGQRRYMLHGLALIGVRSVLGIESKTGSPFNIQRSVHIPNLTYNEVHGLFEWYEKESRQKVEREVMDQVFYETRGQPGLTCWLGEILTEGFDGYTVDKTRPITLRDFKKVERAAVSRLPNNNILNIIGKAAEEPYNETVLSLFKTDEPIKFRFDNKKINYLYMNGVIEPQFSEDKDEEGESYVRFSSPFVQKRLFNYFSDEIFEEMGQLVEPFTNLEQVITPTHLDIRELMKLYQVYLEKNKSWLFKKAPRRSDLRLYEAVFHFNLYAYLDEFLHPRKGRVIPEFPTGNGKIDLLIYYGDKTYGIELKSFTDRAGYLEALDKAAQYGSQLQLAEIYLVTFVEGIDEKTRQTYEADFHHPQTNVKVKPIILRTGAV